MASNSEVLKEYLVSLGFKVDQTSLGKFDNALTKNLKTIKLFAAGVLAAAAATAAFVEHVASDMEDLYWSSVRLRDGVSNIQSFQLAVSKLGGTSEGALSALEGVASFLRTNPGAEGFLNNLGVQTRDAENNLRGTVEILKDFANLPMPYWLKARFAQNLGIDEHTLQAIVRAAPQAQDRLAAFYKAVGLDADKAAESSMEFKNQLRDLEAIFGVVAVKLETALLPAVREIVAGIGNFVIWCIKAGDETSRWLDDLANTPAIKDFVKDTGDLVRNMREIGQALAVAGAWLWKYWLNPQLTTVIKVVGDQFSIILNVLTAITNLLTGRWGAAWDRTKKAFSGVGTMLKDMWHGYTGIIGGFFGGKPGDGLNTVLPAWPDASPDTNVSPADLNNPVGPSGPATNVNTTGLNGPAGQAPGGRQPLGVRTNNPGNLRPGGRQAVFTSAQEGLVAMGRQLLRYSKRGLDTVAKIISTWAPPNENDTKSYIKTVAKALGVDANAGLNIKDPKVLAKLMSAMVRVENGYAPYSGALISGAAERALGAKLGTGGTVTKQVTLNQKTNINVQGSDAPSTGRAVAREQNRVNGDLARNFAGAVQ